MLVNMKYLIGSEYMIQRITWRETKIGGDQVFVRELLNAN